MATGAGDISLPDVSKLNELKDEQIEALIEKLAEVQMHAPQIIAALEAQQEARSRGSKSQGSKGDRKGSSDRGERTQPPKQQQQQQALRHQSPQPPARRQSHNDHVEEEGDEDEEYDDFDEDAEYPMVGDGYSDELSVVSDMTTPTVVSTLEINEEEYYRDMVIGGMKMSAPKKKDLLSQVAKTNARKAPGAAIKKKPIASADVALKKPARAASNYSRNEAITQPEPAIPVAKIKKSKDTGSSPPTAPTSTAPKKIKKKVLKKTPSPQNSGSGWDTSNGGPSSGNKKKGPLEKKPQPVMIDDDGFLVDQSTFETFDITNNPFASAAAPTFAVPEGPDAFAAFDAFNAAPAPIRAPRKATKPKKLNVVSTGKKKGSSSASTSGSSPQQKRKGTRRASVGL